MYALRLDRRQDKRWEVYYVQIQLAEMLRSRGPLIMHISGAKIEKIRIGAIEWAHLFTYSLVNLCHNGFASSKTAVVLL